MSDRACAKSLEPPPLPAVLLEPWPVIAVGAAGLAHRHGAAFAMPALVTWRPFTVAGLAVGVAGHQPSFCGSAVLPAEARAAPKRD